MSLPNCARALFPEQFHGTFGSRAICHYKFEGTFGPRARLSKSSRALFSKRLLRSAKNFSSGGFGVSPDRRLCGGDGQGDDLSISMEVVVMPPFFKKNPSLKFNQK